MDVHDFPIHSRSNFDLTKSHEERYGPFRGVAQSVKKYGFTDPFVVFSDDPVKVQQFNVLSNSFEFIGFQDKPLVLAVFLSLTKDLTPLAVAYELKSLNLPPIPIIRRRFPTRA